MTRTPTPHADIRETVNVIDGAGDLRKLEDIEGEIIRVAISRYDGNISEVARHLGIGRSTLYRKLKDTMS